MLTSILIGLAALVAVSFLSALFLYAHLTGRVTRSTALGVAASAMVVGSALLTGGAMDAFTYSRTATLIGGFFVLAAAVNALLVYQASRPAESADQRSMQSADRRSTQIPVSPAPALGHRSFVNRPVRM